MINITNDIETFFNQHYQVAEYYYGDIDNLSSFERLFPIVVLQNTNSTIEQFNIKYNFDLYCLTNFEQDKDNIQDGLNDTQKILNDFISYFKKNTNEKYWLEIENFTLVPYTEFMDDFTIGWKMNIVFNKAFDYQTCYLPTNNLEIYFSQTSGTTINRYNVLVSAIGGVAPYSGTGIYYNLSAGTSYTFTVTDSNLNSATGTYTVISSYEYKPNYIINFDYNLFNAFVSDFDGYILDYSTTNINSFTINSAALTIPYKVSANTSYLFNIVKTNTGSTATINLNVGLNTFIETIEDINYDVGDGKFTYGVSSGGCCVYKIDNSLLTIVNSGSTGGTWITSPLASTIALPTLPSGGFWEILCYVKSGKMLVGGSSGTASYLKYFCYVNSDDTITNLTGGTGYTSFITDIKSRLYAVMYDFINNIAIFNQYVYELQPIKLNLNTGSLMTTTNIFCFRTDNIKNKIFFNPYKKCFVDISDIYFENGYIRNGFYQIATANESKKMYNRKLNKYLVQSSYNLYIFDENGRAGWVSTPTIPASQVLNAYNYTIDYDKNVIVASISSNRYCVYKNYTNARNFTLAYPDASNIINNGMYAYGDLHLLFSDGGAAKKGGLRLQCIDTSNPTGTTQANFNYYLFPTMVQDIYTNRLL